MLTNTYERQERGISNNQPFGGWPPLTALCTTPYPGETGTHPNQNDMCVGIRASFSDSSAALTRNPSVTRHVPPSASLITAGMPSSPPPSFGASLKDPTAAVVGPCALACGRPQHQYLLASHHVVDYTVLPQGF